MAMNSMIQPKETLIGLGAGGIFVVIALAGVLDGAIAQETAVAPGEDVYTRKKSPFLRTGFDRPSQSIAMIVILKRRRR
jgi:hypothetical protein